MRTEADDDPRARLGFSPLLDGRYTHFMSTLPNDLVPTPGKYVDWPATEATLDSSVAAMQETPRDPMHHPKGVGSCVMWSVS